MNKYQDGVDVSVVVGHEPVSRDSSDWGYPGFLTPDEVRVYVNVKNDIDGRNDPEISDTVYRSFGDFEEPHYALCRWLRARKYDIKETIKMIEEATDMRREPKSKNFYPSPKDALGCPQSVYLAQYPQMCVGVSKQKHPVYISKPGILNVNGLECITSIQGILKYHWFDMHHNFGGVLKKSSTSSDYNRFECVCIIDLDGLSPAQITKRALNIVKVQSEIDSLCFPETLNKLIVVNAPSFFTMTWKVIRNWIDARTANKVEIYSSKTKWQPRLLELISSDQLPGDYGGSAISTKAIMRKNIEGYIREDMELLSIRGTGQIKVILCHNECLSLSVYTRSLEPGEIFIYDNDNLLEMKHIQHRGPGGKEEENVLPTIVTFGPISKSGSLKVIIKCKSKLCTYKYLVVSSIGSLNKTELPSQINEEIEDMNNDYDATQSSHGSKRIHNSFRVPINEQMEGKKSRYSNIIYLPSPPVSPALSHKSEVVVPRLCGISLPALKDIL